MDLGSFIRAKDKLITSQLFPTTPIHNHCLESFKWDQTSLAPLETTYAGDWGIVSQFQTHRFITCFVMLWLDSSHKLLLLPACSPTGFCPQRVLERLWAQQWAFAPAAVAIQESNFFNMPRTSLTLPFLWCQHPLGFFLRDLPATPRGPSSKFLGFANPNFFLSFPQFQVVVSTYCSYHLPFCPISPPIPLLYVILPLL